MLNTPKSHLTLIPHSISRHIDLMQAMASILNIHASENSTYEF